MRYTDITLIKLVDARNDFGDLVPAEERRTVYAGEYSVGMTEVYQGMAVGYKPEVKFLLENWLDYHGEELLEYTPFGLTEPIRYTIIRTYNRGDGLELTCQRDNAEVTNERTEVTN
jgi:hypothetical protein